MAYPENPYKDVTDGDGIHVPKNLTLNPGEIAQRGANGQMVSVSSGTEGQVPVYQADGTLAPGDSSGGGVEGQGFCVLVGATDPIDITEAGASGNFSFSQLTGDANSVAESATIPDWISIDGDDDTVLILEKGTYVFSYQVRASVAAIDGTVSANPTRTGSGPATGFRSFFLSGMNDTQDVVVAPVTAGEGFIQSSWIVSVPSTLAHRRVRLTTAFLTEEVTFTGQLILNSLNVVRIG